MRGLLAIFLTLACGGAEAQQVRQMLNGVRAEQGLGPVAPSPRLESAAMAHAMDMSENGFFGHEGSDGSDVGARVRATGYRPCVVAENIAQGQAGLTDVMGSWVASAPHRDNILRAEVMDYGLVKAPGDIWVLVLGRDGC